MFVMVGYVRVMTEEVLNMANMDHLGICSSCFALFRPVSVQKYSVQSCVILGVISYCVTHMTFVTMCFKGFLKFLGICAFICMSLVYVNVYTSRGKGC